MIQEIQELVAPYNLVAELLDISAVGVAGDGRTYLPVVNLIGKHPGNEVLAQLSTKITNEYEVGRVTFQLI